MAQPGYFTADQIDLNELWYQAQLTAPDQYQIADLPIVGSLVTTRDMTIMKYGIGERNGYDEIALDTKPGMKRVREATMYPKLPRKWGYGVGYGLDSMRLSTGRQIMNNLDRGYKEDV